MFNTFDYSVTLNEEQWKMLLSRIVCDSNLYNDYPAFAGIVDGIAEQLQLELEELPEYERDG